MGCAQLCVAARDPALGQMMVVPSRVVLAGEERSASITVFNRGGVPATYEAVFQHFDMDEGGRLHEIHPVDAGMLEGLLTVAPSKIQLQPGESQVVRILLRKPQELARGEHRIHLTFRARPTEGGARPAPVPALAQGVQVKTLPGISIPVIIRKDTRPSQVSIQDLREKHGKLPGVTFKLCRTGDQSVFGDLTLYEVDGMGVERQLSSMQGLAVYPTRPFRIVEMPFPEPAPPSGTHLRVRFTAKDQEAKAEADLVLAGP